MPMQLPYQTEADPSLPHQVVFYRHLGISYVSCNCMRVRTVNGQVTHLPFGSCDGDLELARRLYNDPIQHGIPFTDKDVAKW